MTTRIVELRRGILKKNDELAAGLRQDPAAPVTGPASWAVVDCRFNLLKPEVVIFLALVEPGDPHLCLDKTLHE